MCLLPSHQAFAFNLNSGAKVWPKNAALFYVRYDQGQFDNAFIQATDAWNLLGNFSLQNSQCKYVDPCDSVSAPDNNSTYKFSNSNCGNPWGDTTLGFTRTWFTNSGNYTEADIIFNDTKNWGIHDMPTSSPFDFKRVAIHELGHAIGLEHANTNSIMQPNYSNTVLTPQQDDINGINALYTAGTPMILPATCPPVDNGPMRTGQAAENARRGALPTYLLLLEE